jgi:pimeloyl-ACP methyl ester carboxylesterase
MTDYARTWGDPAAPTVLLLHPAGGTRHRWTPHAAALQDEYHVVAIDLPAHGTHPVAKFSFDRAVEDVGEILDDVGSAVLVGHSQGGYVAMHAAAEHGERLDGLVLAGSAYNWRRPRMLLLSGLFFGLSLFFDAISLSDRLNGWATDRLSEGIDERQAPPEDEETHDMLHGHAQAARASVLQRTWPAVEAYDGPVLVGHGVDEPLRAHAAGLAERVGGEQACYTGGHQAPMEQTDEFAGLVREFLEDVTREAQPTAVRE